VKYTQRGTITVSCRAFNEPEGLRNSKQVAVEIVVGDTGSGIPASKLESFFREFEQVESAQPKTSTAPGLGLGLAVVARSVEQLGGQLRVDSKVDQGSRFSFLIPFTVWDGCERHLFGQGHERELHPEDRKRKPSPRRSPVRRSETKLRILSVEVRYAVIA
jgi:signal transduction histidine kinase